jgi:hypothetical protein
MDETDEMDGPTPASYSATAVASSFASLVLTSVETTIEYAWASWSNLRSLAFRAWSRIVFAFTATPKAKTLELFGHKGIDGLPHPFHLYSMQQAIEEGFILDVLKGLPRGWSRAWVCASGLLRD